MQKVLLSKGNLYVGGSSKISIANVNGLTTENDVFTIFNYIAMWDGSTWSPLGTGLGATVNAIAIDLNDNVYVGGNFTTLGDNSTVANRVAKWNGSTWSSLASGLGARVNALAVDSNDNLFAGGDFTTLGDGTSANHVAKWNGSTWSPLGSGLGAQVNAIAIDLSDNVYVGGTFTFLGNGTTVANRVAKWTPSGNWFVLGTSAANGVSDGTTTAVNALAIDSSDNVYMSGNFTRLNGTTTVANYVAKWTPSTNTLSTVGGKIIFSTNILLNGIPSISFTIAINKKNDTIYAGSSTTVYQLFSDYVNLQYNGILLRQLYQDGQIISVYTNNKNGKKMCSVLVPNPIYQNYF